MLNLDFTISDLKEYTRENVVSYQRKHINDLFDLSPDVGVEQYELRARELSGEIQPIGMISRSGAPQPEKSGLWACILLEVHEFACGKGGKYQSERKRMSKEVVHCVNVIVTAVIASFSLPAAIVQGLVVIALTSVAKIGVNGWCSYVKKRIA